MKLAASIIGRLRKFVKVEVIPADACVICGHGPNPTTGVPLKCKNGTRAHLSCLLGAQHQAQWN